METALGPRCASSEIFNCFLRHIPLNLNLIHSTNYTECSQFKKRKENQAQFFTVRPETH